MKKYIIFILVLVFVSCENKSKEHEIDSLAASMTQSDSTHHVITNDEYCQSIIDGVGVYAAEITDADMLIIGVDPIEKPSFDVFCQTYLDDATSKGINIKGCLAVDIKTAKFGKNTVVGERIGKAFK